MRKTFKTIRPILTALFFLIMALGVFSTDSYAVQSDNNLFNYSFVEDTSIKWTKGSDGRLSFTWPSGGSGVTYNFSVRNITNNTNVVVQNGMTTTSYRMLTDLTFVPHAQYRISVSVINSSGTTISSSFRILNNGFDQTPAVPAGVRVSHSGTTATVSWNQVPFARAYDVLLDGIAYHKYGAVDSMRFTGLTPGKTYTYRVRAKNSDFASAYSPVMSFTAGRSSLGMPGNLSATVTNNSVTLNWGAVPNATSYGVHFQNTTHSVTNAITRTFTNLSPNTTYEFFIFSRNNTAGSNVDTESNWARIQATTHPNPPTVPTNITATATSNSITVNWNAVTGATGYEILLNGAVHAVPGGTSASRTITGFNFCTNHTYQVRAVNAGGTSAYSASRSIMTLPAVPTNITATSTTTQATISWSAVTGATSYDLLFNGVTYDVTGTSRTITGLNRDTAYTYQVRAKNASGAGTYSSQQTIRTLPDPPAIPTNVNAYATENSVTVSWNTVAGAAGYDVLFNGTVHNVAGGTSTLRTFTGLSPGTNHTYQVRAVNAGGTSAYSASRSVMTIPATPANVTATATANSATVSWASVTGATGYEVLFNGTVHTVTGATVTSRTFTGLSPGSNNTYQVRAVNASGQSAYSTSQSISLAPSTPANVTATATANSVTVSWTAVTGATGYEVLFNGIVHNVAGGTSTLRTFTGLSPGTNHTYQVRAVNAGGASAYSTSRSIMTVPATPTNVNATATANSVTVSWTAVTGATSYEVLINGVTHTVTGGTSTSRTITGLTPGTNYNYQVRAVNASGASAYSAVRSIMTLPAVPANVSATATANSVTVSWTAVTGATGYEILFNGIIHTVPGGTSTSRTITGLTPGTNYTYQVRAVNASGAGAYSSVRTISTLPNPPATPTNITAASTNNSATISWPAVSGATAYDVLFNGVVHRVTGTSIEITGLTPNTGYNYQVRAVNAGGQSTYSAARTVRIAPDAPGNVSAVAAENSVTLSWPAVTGTTGYTVLIDGKEHHVTGTSLTLSDLAPGTEYNYTIRSNNADGQSAYSEGKTFKTLSALPANTNYNATEDSITITWDEAHGATGYTIIFNGTAYEVTGTSKTFTGLTPETEYSYQIRSNNESGNGNYGQSNTAKTLTSSDDGSGGTGSCNNDSCDDSTCDGTCDDGSGDTGSCDNSSCDDSTCDGTCDDGSGNTGSCDNDSCDDSTCDGTCDDGSGGNGSCNNSSCDDSTCDGTCDDGSGNTGSCDNDSCDDSTCDGTCDDDDEPDNPSKMPETDTYQAGLLIRSPYRQYSDGRTPYIGPVSVNALNGVFDFEHIGLTGQASSQLAGDTPYLSFTPINPLDGAFVFEYAALESPEKGFLDFIILYDSNRDVYDGSLGNKWTYSLNYLLHMDDDYIYFVTPGDEIFPFDAETFAQVSSDIAPSMELGKRSDGSYYVREPDRKEYRFTEDFVLSSIFENGQTTYIFASDEQGLITNITDKYDKQLSLEYNDNNQIETVTDYAGRSIGFAYNDNQLASFTNGHGDSLSFAYDANDNLTSVTDFNDTGYIANEYDDDNRVTKHTLLDQGVTAVSYENSSNGEPSDGESKTIFTDEAGNEIIYTIKDGLVTEIKIGDTVIKNEYDSDGRLINQTDALGNPISMAYDSNGRLISITYPNGTREQIYYNSQNHPTRFINRDGTEINYDYDERNNLTSRTDERGNTEFFTYDRRDNQTSHTDRNGHSQIFAYENDRLNSSTDAEGNLRHYLFDEVGRLYNYTSPEGRITHGTYSTMGDLLSIQTPDGTVYYNYDKNGNRISASDFNENTQYFSYNAQGQIISATDFQGNQHNYFYDDKGRLISETDPLGNSRVYTYDAFGNMVSVADENGNTTTFTYNAINQLTGITDASGNTTSLDYEKNGMIGQVTNPFGNQTRYSYDTMGRVIGITDALGYRIDYSYDEVGNLVSEIDQRGSITSFTYDNENNLTAVIKGIEAINSANELNIAEPMNLSSVSAMEIADLINGTSAMAMNDVSQINGFNTINATQPVSLSGATSFSDNSDIQPMNFSSAANNKPLSASFDSGFQPLATTPLIDISFDNNITPLNTTPINDTHVTSFTYDKLSRLISIKDAEGHIERLAYNGDSNIISSTDKENHQTTFAYNQSGRLITETTPDSESTGYSYDKNGNLTQLTNAGGNTYHYSYDKNNRLTQTINPLGYSIDYAYDSKGNLVSVTDAKNNITTYDYDRSGNLIKVANPLGGTKTYTYTKNGLLKSVKDENGHTQNFDYDAAGNLITHTDANDNVWNYEYNANNLVVKITDANDGTITMSYNAAGDLTRLTDQEGAETNYYYDYFGRLSNTRDALSGNHSYIYDNLGRILSEIDARGNETNFNYSPKGNLLSVTAPNAQTTSFTYDALGRVLTEKNALGHITGYTYNALGQLTEIKNPLNQQQFFTYTVLGELATSKDTAGNLTTYEYDPNGNIERIIEPSGLRIQYFYDQMNNPTIESVSANDDSGALNTFMYYYDPKGQVIREITSANEEITYFYDGNGNLIQKTNEDGNNTVINYDLHNNSIAISYNNGREDSFTYNKRGDLIQFTDPTGTTNLDYDTLGRLIGVIDHNNRETGYAYDLAGNLTAINYPGGDSTVSYVYDNSNRLINVTDSEGGLTTYDYDLIGNPLMISQPNGNTTSFVYDVLSRPTKVSYQTGGTVMEETHTYNALGYITNSIRTGGTPNFNRNVSYSYDRAGRLTSYTNKGRTESYSYSPRGNMTTKRINGSVRATYNFNDADQLISKTENGNFTYDYDKRGNLIREIRGGTPIMEYSYDVTNRMVKGKDLTTGESTEYIYNALGKNVRNTQNLLPTLGGYMSAAELERLTPLSSSIRIPFSTKETDYVINYLSPFDTELMAIEDGFGTAVFTYGLGETRLSQSITPAENPVNRVRTDIAANTIGTLYLQPDLLGSPLLITNSSGNIIRHAERDAWGNLKLPVRNDINSAGVEFSLLYTNHRHDEVIDKYFMRARNYDPVNYRFGQRDPARQGINDFLYCANNPINYTDPDGRIMQFISDEKHWGTYLEQLQKLTNDTIHIDVDGILQISNRVDKPTLKHGTDLIRRLVDTKYVVSIDYEDGVAQADQITVGAFSYHQNFKEKKGIGSGTNIVFDPYRKWYYELADKKGKGLSTMQETESHITFAHELIHAERFSRGIGIMRGRDYDHEYISGVRGNFLWWPLYARTFEKYSKEEYATIGLGFNKRKDVTENMIRKEHQLRLRARYGTGYSELSK